MSKLSERRKQIREYNQGEAEQELDRLRRQLFDLRIQQQRGEVKNNRQFTQVRTDIARLMYQLNVLNRAALEDAELEEADEVGEVEEAEEGEEVMSSEASAEAEVEGGEAPAEAIAEEEIAPASERRDRRAKAKEEEE